LRPLDRLVPYATNPRQHSLEQVEQLAASIREWGWTNPILVDEDGTIIAGHGRVMAAKQLGLAAVPTMVAKGWSEAQRSAYVLADNKLTLNATWDVELLRQEFTRLEGLEFDLGLTGFSQVEIESTLGQPLELGEDAWQDMPEYEHEDQTSWHKVIVHFANAEDLARFARLVEQSLTDKTRSIWYPKAEIVKTADKEYSA
jgi:ParB-like chromosome segregation protein Spo0J